MVAENNICYNCVKRVSGNAISVINLKSWTVVMRTFYTIYVIQNHWLPWIFSLVFLLVMFYFVLLVYYSIAFDSTFTYFFSYGIESQIFDSSRKRKTKQDPPKKPYASIIILKRFAKERWETKKTVMEGQLCFWHFLGLLN